MLSNNHHQKIIVMKLTSFFVKNYQFTLVAFVMVIVVSVTTMFNMPRAEDPEIK